MGLGVSFALSKAGMRRARRECSCWRGGRLVNDEDRSLGDWAVPVLDLLEQSRGRGRFDPGLALQRLRCLSLPCGPDDGYAGGLVRFSNRAEGGAVLP
jgi:hypothetical protein